MIHLSFHTLLNYEPIPMYFTFIWMLGSELGSFWVIALAWVLLLFSIQIGLNSSSLLSISTKEIFISYTVEFSISILKWYQVIITMFWECLTLDAIACYIYVAEEIQCCLGNNLVWGLEFIAALGRASLREKQKILKTNHGETKVCL